MYYMKYKEKLIEIFLKFCASITIFTTIGIVAVLLFESISFFRDVSIFEFLTDTQWTPLFSEKHFGILALVSGTFLTASIAKSQRNLLPNPPPINERLILIFSSIRRRILSGIKRNVER